MKCGQCCGPGAKRARISTYARSRRPASEQVPMGTSKNQARPPTEAVNARRLGLGPAAHGERMRACFTEGRDDRGFSKAKRGLSPGRKRRLALRPGWSAPAYLGGCLLHRADHVVNPFISAVAKLFRSILIRRRPPIQLRGMLNSGSGLPTYRPAGRTGKCTCSRSGMAGSAGGCHRYSAL